MARLLFVRHGETTGNSAERYWGHTDVALSAHGMWQAERLRLRLERVSIDAVYCSDLVRAADTARTIASRRGLEITACPELREINFGQLEGLDFAGIAQRHPEVARLWRERSALLRYPGGEGMEDFRKRVLGFAPRLETHAPEKTVLVVAHSASLRVLLCHLLGLDPAHWWQFRLDLASFSSLDTYPEGAILDRLNDVSHLGERNGPV